MKYCIGTLPLYSGKGGYGEQSMIAPSSSDLLAVTRLELFTLTLSTFPLEEMVSAEHLLQMYNEARKEDAASEILDRLEDEYFETKYKNNNKELQRAKIIANLDPFRHKTAEQVKELYTLGLIERKDFLVKFNLSTYIKRFERENISLLRFGELIDFKTKIERIKDALYSYVPEVEQAQIEE